jgi:hypothetical protein
MSEPSVRRRAEILNCPVCGEAIGVTLMETARVETCPHCGSAYTVPSVDGSIELPKEDPFAIIDDEPEDEEAAARRLKEERESRLNALHVASVTAERRAKTRLRLFCLGGATLCLVGLIQTALLLVQRPEALQERRRAIGLAAAAAGMLYFALWLFRKSMRLGAELRRPLQLDPDRPPDFTPLQDGSQRWKNLEKM